MTIHATRKIKAEILYTIFGPIDIVIDDILPTDYLEIRSGDQRVGCWLSDPDGSIARWLDDGGAR